MQTVSGILPTTLSPSELKSDDERTFQFDEETEVAKLVDESEDLRRLINKTTQLGIKVDHIHSKTDQEIARLEKVIEEVAKNDSLFRSCSSKLKRKNACKHASDSESSTNTQLKSLSHLHGRHDHDWKQKLNRWFRKNKSKFAIRSASDLKMTDVDNLFHSQTRFVEDSKSPYFSETDGYMNGLDIISPLTPDDLDDNEKCVKLDEPSQACPNSDLKKTSSSPTFGNHANNELVVNGTESIVSEPPLQESKKIILKYRSVRTSRSAIGSAKATSKNNSSVFRIFHKSSGLIDKNQEDVPRMWDVVRNNLEKEVFLLQERFKRWTSKHKDTGKTQVLNSNCVTIPLSLSESGPGTQSESGFCSMLGSEALLQVQA
ncbi:hypothetical protein SEUBUCD646_0P03500 [Saccharomyces eubayanus]|uniref:YPR078C-like protein n=1 Tax=Saccharomyces eubayanus TaxID=1080349 RepID=A0ABN8VJL0_SACEU|nr:hypothetical protein SEUBUCD650_0P03510 [Saccharomyces eubayanus]CAI1813382.1 hypothetical protein SEUBUCD646_0P03500 [Saccharomyces eubayanus]